MKSILAHPLIKFLAELRGNPKACLLIEPLWGIPYNLITPFATLYMYALGVNDIQIGLLLSISMAFQVVLSFLGGIITDKLGRRTTTIAGDLVGWSAACFVWAISRNFWFFLLAMLLNSFEQVNQTAWHCLLIEDANKDDTLKIYTWTMIAGLLAVFFAPVSGVLIGRYSLVPVVRALYMIFCVSMLLKDYITWKYCSETEQGRIRRQQVKGVSVLKMVLEYRELVPRIFKNKATMQTLAINIALYITNMINVTFFGLYVNMRLGIPEKYLAIFPIFRAAVMLVFMFALQHLFEKLRFKVPLQIGFIIFISVQALLILSPKEKLLPMIIYILLEAVASSLIAPRKESMLIMNVDQDERARIIALIVTFTIVFSIPFGYFAGYLSSIDRRLPFAFNILLAIFAIVVTASFQEEPVYLTDDQN